MDIRKIAAITLAIIVLVVAGYALADENSDKMMAAAREALNREQFAKAAQLMHEVYELEQETEAAGNALYWEAFARYRLKKTTELKVAAELLRLQQKEFENVETAREGETLLARLHAELAERGEIDSITEIDRISEEESQREETRIQALHALMRMNPDKALPILEKIVKGETKGSAELRRNALFVLCRVDDERSEDLLIELMHETTDPEMLSEIVMCLSMKESDRALDAIVLLFEKSDDPEIDEAAMFAIGRHGGDRAFEILAGIARDPNKNSEMRAQALFGLSQAGRDEEVAEVAADLLRTEDDNQVIEAALFSLSRLDGDVPDQVYMDLINNPQANDEMRSQALFFAAQRGDLSLDFLRDVYRKADSTELKLQVCHAISRLETSDAGLDALIEIARAETDPEIRQNAMFWIGQYDNDKAAEFLLEIINQD